MVNRHAMELVRQHYEDHPPGEMPEDLERRLVDLFGDVPIRRKSSAVPSTTGTEPEGGVEAVRAQTSMRNAATSA